MNQKKALFIDDDSAYLNKLIKAVKLLGYDCRMMSDSQQAAELVCEERFDVLVTDIAMPGKNGYELIRELRTHDSGTFVIAISGQSDENVESQALENGADVFFTKPLELESFLSTLSYIFGEKRNNGNGLP